jgi:hypothetical protein
VMNGRRAIGIELKTSYYRQAVRNLQNVKATDINEGKLDLDIRATQE